MKSNDTFSDFRVILHQFNSFVSEKWKRQWYFTCRKIQLAIKSMPKNSM